jgi:hypothetical protein
LKVAAGSDVIYMGVIAATRLQRVNGGTPSSMMKSAIAA